MDHLIGHYQALGWTAAKALLLFLMAVVGLRLAERRTLAQLSAFDFAVTVAVGAIIGRTATADTSFATGAVALLTVLLAHHGIAIMHRNGWLSRLLDRRPLLLVTDGQLHDHKLKSAGLTRRDLLRLLRQTDADDLDTLHYVLYEDGGTLTTIPSGAHIGTAQAAGLREAGIDQPRLRSPRTSSDDPG